MMPLSKATSPLMRTCKNKSASFVPLPSHVQTSCGCLKLAMPDFGQRIDVHNLAAATLRSPAALSTCADGSYRDSDQ